MRVTLLVLLALLSPATAAEDKPAPFVWDPQNKQGVRILLIGTIAVSDPATTTITPLLERAYELSHAVYTQEVTDLEKLREQRWRRAKAGSGGGVSVPKEPTYLKDTLDKTPFQRARALIDFIESDQIGRLICSVLEADESVRTQALDNQGKDIRSITTKLAARGRRDKKTVGGMLEILDSEDRWAEALADLGS